VLAEELLQNGLDYELGLRIWFVFSGYFVPRSREYTAAFSILQPFAHTLHKISGKYKPYSKPK
jgi:hypothetical protein